MAQPSQGIQLETVFADCRALVFHCSTEVQQWTPVGETGSYSRVQLIQYKLPQGNISYRIYGRLETSGRVILDHVLQPSFVYSVTEPTWHQIQVDIKNIYGLKLSPESDGGKFSVVLQNLLRSLQATAVSSQGTKVPFPPPFPREAWTPSTVPTQLTQRRSPEPPRDPVISQQIRPTGVPQEYHWDPVVNNYVVIQHPGVTMEPQIPPLTSITPPPQRIQTAEAPRSSNVTHSRRMYEEQVDSLCGSLTSAIAEGDMLRATEAVKLMAADRLSLSIKLKNPMQLTVDPSNDDTISLRVVVEDSETSGGAFTMKVSPNTTIETLKEEVLERYGFPLKVQKWIIGKMMRKSKETLNECHVRQNGCTAFLYLVSGRNVGLTRADIEALQRGEYPRVQPLTTAPARGVIPSEAQRLLNGVSASELAPAAPAMHHASSVHSLASGNQSGNGSMGGSLPSGNLYEAGPFPSGANIPPSPSIAQLTTTLTGTDNERAHLQASNLQGLGMGSIHNLTQLFRQLPAQNQMNPMYGEQFLPEQEILNDASREPRGVPVEDSEENEGWACSQCTYKNSPTRPGCEMCGSERPRDYVVPQNVNLDDQERSRLQEEHRQTELFNEAERAQSTLQESLRGLIVGREVTD